MTLKDIFLGKNRKPEVAFDGTGAMYPIPNIRELEEFRKDSAEGHNDRVKAFLDKYSGDYVDDIGKYGWSPLKLAAWRGQSETVALLRKAQAQSFGLS